MKGMREMRGGMRGGMRGLAATVAFAIVAIFLIQATAGAISAASPATASFPYSYGVPVVPKGVGAQGVQGPNVPTSQIGPSSLPSQDLPTGHLGPVNNTNWYWTATMAKLTIQVRNGSIASSTAGSFQPVAMENVTTGQWRSNHTSQSGFTNITMPEGWYVMFINATSPATFISFLWEFNFHATATIVRYLLPTAESETTVHNGATASDTKSVWVTVLPGWSVTNTGIYSGSPDPTQISVILRNDSASGAFLASATTGDNATAGFIQLNSAYSYGISAIGYSQVNSSVKYFMQNTSNVGASTAGINYIQGGNGLLGTTSTTGSLTGSAFSAFAWTISLATTITGGVTYISCWPTVSAELTFVNSLVFLNWSNYINPIFTTTNLVRFINSTFVMLSPSVIGRGTDLFDLTHSVFYGTEQTPAYPYNGVSPQPGFFFTNTNWSVVTDLGNMNSGTTNLPILGNFTDSYLTNVTRTMQFGAVSFSHSKLWLVNASQTNAFGQGDNEVYSYSTILDSFILNGASVSLINSTLQSSEFYQEANAGPAYTEWMNVTNTWLNATIPTTQLAVYPAWGWTTGGNPSFLTNTKGLVSHSFISFVVADGSTWSQYYAALKASTLWKNSLGFSDGAYFVLPQTTNISYSIVNFSAYPRINITAFKTYYLDLYDDLVTCNYTNAQTASWTLANPQTGMFEFSEVSLWANYTEFDLATSAWVQTRNGTAFDHDVFPWFVYSSAGLYIGVLQEAQNSAMNSVASIQNSTIGYFYVNASYAYPRVNEEYGPVAQDFISNAGEPTSYTPSQVPPGLMKVAYNTFLGRPGGAGSAFNPILVDAGQWNKNASIIDNVFYNRAIAGPQPYYAAPYSEDINAQAGNITIIGNWFLNLNNQTMPVADQIVQNTGHLGTLNISSNHYYYSPLPIQSYVNVANTMRSQVSPGSSVDSNPSSEAGGSITLDNTPTYEMGIGTGIRVVVMADKATYFSNSSILQTPPPYAYMQNMYSWSVAPDVNASTGSPIISYSSGLVAGPQPNFYWHGYNYSEQVEPSYMEVGVNSSKAPPVVLALQGSPLTTYQLTMTDMIGGAVTRTSVQSGATGIVNVTYDPATDPSLALLSIGGFGAGGPPCGGTCTPPPPPPSVTVPSFTISFNPLLVLGVILVVVGAVLIATYRPVWYIGTVIIVAGVAVAVLSTVA